jgi:hypothetical protein
MRVHGVGYGRTEHECLYVGTQTPLNSSGQSVRACTSGLNFLRLVCAIDNAGVLLWFWGHVCLLCVLTDVLLHRFLLSSAFHPFMYICVSLALFQHVLPSRPQVKKPLLWLFRRYPIKRTGEKGLACSGMGSMPDRNCATYSSRRSCNAVCDLPRPPLPPTRYTQASSTRHSYARPP